MPSYRGVVVAFAALQSLPAAAQTSTVVSRANAAAQGGVSFVVPDAVNWVKAQRCAACHRGGGPLYGASIAAHTGFRVDTSSTTGTTWLARWIAGEQCLTASSAYSNSCASADGGWSHYGSFRHAKSGYALYGLAGYTAYSGDTSLLPNVKAGVSYMMTQAQNASLSGAPNARLISQDHGSFPTTYDWAIPTAQAAVAARVVVENDPTLTVGDRSSLTSFLNSTADALGGAYWANTLNNDHLQSVVYANIGLIAARRDPASDPTLLRIKDDLVGRHQSGAGWGDPSIGSGSDALTTGEVLYALCLDGVRLDSATTAGRAVAEAILWLAGTEQNDGSWAIPYHANDLPTIYSVLGLGCYGTLNVTTVASGTFTTIPTGATGATVNTTSVSFTVSVTNSGYTTNTYNILASGGVPGSTLTANPPTLTLAPNQSGTSTITMTLPPGVPSSTVVPITVTTTYTTSTGVAGQTASYTVYVGDQPASNAPATAVAISPVGTVALGDTVYLRATVTSAGAAVTRGSLTFYVGSAAIGTAYYDAASQSFRAPWTVLGTTTGDQTVSAVYGGFSGGGVQFAPSSASTTAAVIRVPPPAPVLGVPPYALSDNAFSLNGTGVAGATVSVIANGVLAGTLPVDATGRIVGTLRLPYGTQHVTIFQTTVGGSSPSVDLGNVVVSPPAPIVAGFAEFSPVGGIDTAFSAAAGGITTAVAVRGVVGSTLVVTDVGGVAVAGPLAADAAGTFTLAPRLGFGAHVLVFTLSIGGGSSSTVRRVNVQPAVPVLSSIASGQRFVGTGPSVPAVQVPIAATGAVPGGTLDVFDGGAAAGHFAVGAAGGVTAAVSLAYGPHSIRAVSTVAAWNGGLTSGVATVAVLCHAVPAPPQMLAPVDGARIVGTRVAVAGAAVPGAALAFTESTSGGASVGGAVADAAGSFAGAIDLFYGFHAVSLTQSMGGEVSAPTAAARIGVYPAAPSLTQVPPPLNNNPGFAGRAAAGNASFPASVVVYDGALRLATVAVRADGTWSFNGLLPSRLLADGPHTLRFTVVINGMESAAISDSFVLWTQPPQLVILAPANGSTQETATQPIQTAFASSYAPPAGVSIAQIAYLLDGVTLYAGPPAGAPPSLDLSLAMPGPHLFAVSAIDNLGNADSAPFTSRFTFGPSLDTDIALTQKLLGPLVATRCDDDDDHHRRAPLTAKARQACKKSLTRGNLRSLLEKLYEAKKALGEHGESPAEIKHDAIEHLWGYIRELSKLEAQGRVPVNLAELLKADVSWTLDKLGGPPRRHRES